MHIGILFAIITATALGFWTFFHKLASPHVNSLFWAIIISLTAVIIGAIFLVPNIKITTLYSDVKGVIFLVLSGVSVITIDYFALKTYWTNIPISIAWPIIMWGSIVIAIILGLCIWEQMTLLKLLGISLIAIGTVILSMIA